MVYPDTKMTYEIDGARCLFSSPGLLPAVLFIAALPILAIFIKLSTTRL